ncbi:M4 family metallopeptidase [Macrococcus armenti]|uniref:M4 family metallopeptidase n=1 Tax=Macrococcus armenti TaxID=2875764 RepID=UPI001CCF567D|nr:M4 family metallopeptidase [Macrococcus armenti]UBH12955.1 M4 family metallopeptidase [Macrococcus armenti]UBH22195.1 M4 family metallopeptidase [Macrococcus armenti]
MKKNLILPSALLLTIALASQANAESIPQKSLSEVKTITSTQDIKPALKMSPINKNVKANLDQYKIVETKKDKKGFKHYTLVPHVNGVKALNSEIKVHTDAKGNVTFINGELNQKKLVPTNTVTLSKVDAVTKAFTVTDFKQSEVKNFKNKDVVKFNNLVIDPILNKYIYNIRIIYVSPRIETWDVKVDAQTGEILYKRNLAESENFAPSDSAIGNDGTPAAGRGVSTKGMYRPLKIFKSNVDNRFWLSDQTNPTLMETYDLFSTDVQRWQVMSSDSTIFRSENLKPAVDAHYYANQTYKYYKDVHGRESYDGNGAPLYSMVHYKYKENNAFWTGEAMVYGDGDGREFGPLSQANDIVAHELTHAITFNTAGLEYAYEPGALNESFSDVMAYFLDPDWLMGEDAYTPNTPGDALRSFDNPEKYGQPSHYSKRFIWPNTEDGDFGAVHWNSGIPNKAFYNVIAVEGLSADKAQHIYYKTLVEYLTPYSQFKDCKAALMRAARDLYGTTEEQQIKRAWDAVGVY